MKYSNPKYVAYAKAHGKSTDEMMAYDEQEWVGGCMCGFLLWISQQKERLYKAHPECFLDRWTIGDEQAWDRWLNEAAKAKQVLA